MSYLTKEMKSGQTHMGTIVVLPSQADFSDIEQLQQCNRGANEPKSELDGLMKSVKARGGFVTPLKGYLNAKKHLMITNGSRRLAVGQALEAEGDVFPLPVVLVKMPETDEEIRALILDSAVDNSDEFRKTDSPAVLHESFDTLRKMDMSYQEIGEATGFSHQKVYNLLRSFDIKPLKEAILKGEISDRAATEYFTEQYVKKGKDGKPVTAVEERDGKKVRVKVYDEQRIADALKKAKESANAAGKTKVGARATKGETQAAHAGKTPAPGMSAIKIILDEPEDNIPAIFRKFGMWLTGDLKLEDFKKHAKKNNYWDEIEWLFEIEFNKEARKAAEAAKKAEKDKAKASKATKAKKDDPMVSDEEELDSEDYE